MNKKLLIVDDDPVLINLLVLRLESNGYDVLTAENGIEGLEKAREFKPDLIILDMLMPGMDGGSVAAELRLDPQLKDVPVIFLTCIVSKDEEKEHEHNIGGHMFFAKPFDSVELVSVINKLL